MMQKNFQNVMLTVDIFSYLICIFFSEGGNQEGDEADLVAHGVSKRLVTNKVL